MTEPYLFEKAIGQQMGDLCRLAVGEAKVTQTGEIVTLEDMLGRGNMGVSVEVPYTSGGVQSVSVTRCGQNLLNIFDRVDGTYEPTAGKTIPETPVGAASLSLIENGVEIRSQSWRWYGMRTAFLPKGSYRVRIYGKNSPSPKIRGSINITDEDNITQQGGVRLSDYDATIFDVSAQRTISAQKQRIWVSLTCVKDGTFNLSDLEVVIAGVDPTFEPYTGDTYTITLPADFYGGTVNLATGTVTSRYAADGTELAEPVVTEIDPISIPILAGVNNVWADVGTVTVSYYAADAETFLPALWYPTIYRGLTSARYLIKRASGAIASFSDAVAAPLVGLRVALPWRSEGYDAVEVTRCGKNLLETVTRTKSPLTYVEPSTPIIFNIHEYYVGFSYSGWIQSGRVNSFFVGENSLKFTADEFWGIGLPIEIKENQYYISWQQTGSGRLIVLWCDRTGRRLSFTVVESGDIVTPRTGASIMVLNFQSTTTNEEADFSDIMIAPIPTAYEPYNGDTYTISLPTTIYGGYLDAVTGQLVATHDENGNLLTNQKLYFLPPTNINALAGVNNIWSDAGDVAVSYRVEQ